MGLEKEFDNETYRNRFIIKNSSSAFLWRNKEKQVDPEQGRADHDPDRANLGKNVKIKPSPYEQRRAEAKQMWKDFVFPHKEGALDQNNQNDQAIENEAKEIVNWLRKEVLSITSDTIANKVEKK